MNKDYSRFDYYPFGMVIKERSFSVNDSYRFGFNGKENDNDVKGEGNQIDFGARVYDARLGSWLSVDPHSNNYPFYSPYSSFNNNPVYYIDYEGRDAIASIEVDKKGNKTLIIKANYHYLEGEVSQKVLDLVKTEFKKNGNRKVKYNGETLSVRFELNFISHTKEEMEKSPSYYNSATGDNDLVVTDLRATSKYQNNVDVTTNNVVVLSNGTYDTKVILPDGSESKVSEDAADNAVANALVHGIGHNIGFVHGEKGKGVMKRQPGNFTVTNGAWQFEWSHISESNVQELVDRIDEMKNQGKDYWQGKMEKNLEGNKQTNSDYGKEEKLERTGITTKDF